MNIPWRLKSLAYRALSYMPSGVLYFSQRHITKRSLVNIREIHRGWRYHARVASETGAQTLIEFGAGKTLVQNLYLSQYLDKQTVVDLSPMLELPMLNQAAAQLRALGVPLPDCEITSVDELEEVYGIRYLAPFDMCRTDFPDESFDICTSTNTLEHVPRQDIADIFAELHRIIKPDGVVSAMIDYSDHYAHSDRSLSRLHYLRYSDAAWQAHNHPNHYQNRLRHGHYRQIFEAAGFVASEENPTDAASPQGLKLREELLTGAGEDFATTGFWVLRKA